MASPLEQLFELADLFGVQTAYWDVSGQQRHATPEALLPVLQGLGASLGKVEDASQALRERRQQFWGQMLPPVAVLWDQQTAEIKLRLPAVLADGPCRCTITRESGETQEWSLHAAELPVTDAAEVEGVRYALKGLRIPGPLPLGYHRLRLETGGSSAECLLISAPRRAYEPAGGSQAGSWGAFVPLYALHSKQSWGAGDFSDLEALTEWVTGLGGGMVATLPVLAAFLDEPFEPGPYSPASRLFWNEFYLDVHRIPELQSSPRARAFLDSGEFKKEVEALRAEPLVDYARQMSLKRRILSELARSFFAGSSSRMDSFRRFNSTRPEAEDYACFRAVGERRKAPWPTWPERQRDGLVRQGDYDEDIKRYHLYVQWLADEQLQGLAGKARAGGAGFYLDLPLGVNPDSYDVWRERQAFAMGMAAGAPPDPFFAKGQNWGFPPLHPERIRQDGFRYVIAYLRHHLRLAGVLRIDHMMGFHRLFWIPHGFDAQAGIYVRYPAEELYAIFSLESQRHQTVLVGEDLGTVPEEVRPAMAEHNIRRMYVLQYELQPQYQNALNPVYPGCVASLNTHDMPPFAAWWEGQDVRDRVELGILDHGVAEEELRRRRALLDALIQTLRSQGKLHDPVDPRAVLKACLRHMSDGSALVVLANLEDLWLETEAQNMPGTWRERPNWRRRVRYPLEEFRALPQVLDLLKEVDQAMKGKTDR